MSDSLIIVMAHRDASDTVIRHWPLWAAHGLPIMVFAPADSIPRIDPHIPLLLYGRAEHHGVESVRRFKWLLKFLGGMELEFAVIHEYDSMILDPRPEACELLHEIESDNLDVVGGNHFVGDDRGNFQGSNYLHPPFIFRKRALELLNDLDLSDHAERGFYDRWLGLALEGIPGIRIGGWIEKYGFSRNTIEPEHHTEAIQAASDGRRFYHGIKNEMSLHLIQEAFNKSQHGK